MLVIIEVGHRNRLSYVIRTRGPKGARGLCTIQPVYIA